MGIPVRVRVPPSAPYRSSVKPVKVHNALAGFTFMLFACSPTFIGVRVHPRFLSVLLTVLGGGAIPSPEKYRQREYRHAAIRRISAKTQGRRQAETRRRWRAIPVSFACRGDALAHGLPF